MIRYAFLLLFLFAVHANAQPWPARPIRIVVAQSPGGFSDVPARLLAPRLSQGLGTPVFVDNKPGAGGTLGADFVAKSAPDGYTLLVIGAPHVISPWLYKKLPYDVRKDFAAVGMFASGPYALVVSPTLPANSLRELIAIAKAQPGVIDFASSGNGSGQHLVAAMLFSMAGITLNHIPYKGSAPAMQDLLAGEVKVLFAGIPNVLPHVKAGRLRVLAVTTSKRWPELPDVPTVAEAGVPGYEATLWQGFAAPARTPPEIAQKLFSAIAKALEDEELQRLFRASGIERAVLPSRDFAELISREHEAWGRVVRQTGVTLD
jgi:tripartite-type tricarboxylate transporter receptor subunit TctC